MELKKDKAECQMNSEIDLTTMKMWRRQTGL